jgi:hypothetical protein
MRTTDKQVQTIFARLLEVSGLPGNEDEATARGLDRFLAMEYAREFGGYRLIMVKIGSYSHAGAFGGNGSEARLKASEMYTRIKSLIDGIDFASSFVVRECKHEQLIDLSGMGVINFYCGKCGAHFFRGANSPARAYSKKEWDLYVELEPTKSHDNF